MICIYNMLITVQLIMYYQRLSTHKLASPLIHCYF